MRTARGLLPLVALSAFIALAAPGQAFGAPTELPRLQFLTPEKISLYPGTGKKPATTVVTILNSGPKVASGLAFRIVAKGGATVVSGNPPSLAGFAAQRVKLSFKLAAGVESSTGHLVASAPGHQPAAVPFDLAPKEDVPTWVEPVILGSLGLAALLVLVGYLWASPRCPPGERLGPVDWDFSKSWASNLTIFSALLGTILAAGVLPAETSARKTSVYAGLNLLFGIGVLVGPVLYAAFQRPKAVNKRAAAKEPQYQGYVWAFALATLVTMWAILGELATIWALFTEIRSAGSMPGSGLVAFKVLIAVGGAMVILLALQRMNAILSNQCDPDKRTARRKAHHAQLKTQDASIAEEKVEPPLDSWPIY